MTRDELRAAIQETVDSMRGDSIMALAATNAIMDMVDRYSIGVVLDAYRAGNPHGQVTDQDAIDWLKARK